MTPEVPNEGRAESPYRVAVFGDSIAKGLGARGETFGKFVADALGARLIDMSDPALQVRDSLDRVESARGADLVLIAHGATEALIRPSDRALKLVPRRWRKAGGLDPRTYFSTRLHKRIPQYLLSEALWRWKLVLMRAVGTAQWATTEEFRRDLTALIGELDPASTVVLSTLAVDNRFFPGSPRQFEIYSGVAAEAAATTGTVFVDVSDCCVRWSDYCDDNFHPTAGGHRKVADRILEALPADVLSKCRSAADRATQTRP